MATGTDTVPDPQHLLEQDDHMRDMDRLELEVIAILSPFPSVARVVGRIAPQDPAAWLPANLAVRIEVETPAGERPVSRVYTIRSFDPTANTIEIDFVRHEDDSPAMRWLNAARAGARVWMTGPRQHFVPDHEGGRRVALVADETAIPAAYAILQQWPQGATGAVWIETADPAAFDELPRPEGAELHLIQRRPDQPAGSTGALFSALRAAIPDPSDWTIWAAGERREMRDIRNHFRALGLGHHDMRVIGYWKRGASSSEIDRVRLAEYTRLRKSGAVLEDFSDVDLPI